MFAKLTKGKNGKSRTALVNLDNAREIIDMGGNGILMKFGPGNEGLSSYQESFDQVLKLTAADSRFVLVHKGKKETTRRTLVNIALTWDMIAMDDNSTLLVFGPSKDDLSGIKESLTDIAQQVKAKKGEKVEPAPAPPPVQERELVAV